MVYSLLAISLSGGQLALASEVNLALWAAFAQVNFSHLDHAIHLVSDLLAAGTIGSAWI